MIFSKTNRLTLFTNSKIKKYFLKFKHIHDWPNKMTSFLDFYSTLSGLWRKNESNILISVTKVNFETSTAIPQTREEWA